MHCIALHYIASRYITLHYITLRCSASHDLTLHLRYLGDNKLYDAHKIGKYNVMKILDKITSFSNVALASYITAYARIHMCKVRGAIGKHTDLLYTDTDSVIFEYKQSEELDKVIKSLEGLNRGKDLGYLKNELGYDSSGKGLVMPELTVMGCKVYASSTPIVTDINGKEHYIMKNAFKGLRKEGDDVLEEVDKENIDRKIVSAKNDKEREELMELREQMSQHQYVYNCVDKLYKKEIVTQTSFQAKSSAYNVTIATRSDFKKEYKFRYDKGILDVEGNVTPFTIN